MAPGTALTWFITVLILLLPVVGPAGCASHWLLDEEKGVIKLITAAPKPPPIPTYVPKNMVLLADGQVELRVTPDGKGLELRPAPQRTGSPPSGDSPLELCLQQLELDLQGTQFPDALAALFHQVQAKGSAPGNEGPARDLLYQCSSGPIAAVQVRKHLQALAHGGGGGGSLARGAGRGGRGCGTGTAAARSASGSRSGREAGNGSESKSRSGDDSGRELLDGVPRWECTELGCRELPVLGKAAQAAKYPINHVSQYQKDSAASQAISMAVAQAMNRAGEQGGNGAANPADNRAPFPPAPGPGCGLSSSGNPPQPLSSSPGSVPCPSRPAPIASATDMAFSTSEEATILLFRHSFAGKRQKPHSSSLSGAKRGAGGGPCQTCAAPEQAGGCGSRASCHHVNGAADEGAGVGERQGPLRQELAMATLFSRYGGVDAALEILERTAAMNPEDARIWNDLGNANHAKGDLQRALECLQHALTLATHPDLQLNLGAVHYLLGNLHEARDAFQQGLEEDSSHALLHFSLAHVLLELGRKDDALVSLEEALRLQPDFTAADVHVQQLKLQMGQPWGFSLAWALGLLAFIALCFAAQRTVQQFFVTQQHPSSPKSPLTPGRRKRRP